MNAAEISEQLNVVAVSLNEVDARAASRVRSLASSLSSETGILHWSDVDLRRVFNVERLSYQYALHREGGYASRITDFADRLRNVLVLVPIFLTWAALAEGVRSYANYLDAHPDESNLPFLLLWQRGFGGEASSFAPSFSAVAILDAAILLVIILLTFYAHGRKEAREDKITDRAAIFQADFENILAETSVYLATDRASRPQQLASSVESLAERFERSTQELLNQLQVEHDRLESLAGRREKEFADFGVFASGLRAGADEMHRLLVDLRQVSTALESSLDDLTGEVSIAGDQQRSMLTAIGNLERVTSSAIQSDQAVMRQLAVAANTLSETAEKTISGAEAASQASRTASDAVRGIGQLAQQIAESQGRVETALGSGTESNRRLAEALQVTTANAQHTATAFSDVQARLERIQDEFSRMGGQSAQQIEAFNALMTRQSELARAISEAARELGSSTLTGAQRQREVNDEIQHLVQRLDGITNTMNRLLQQTPNTENLQQAFAAALRSELNRAGSGAAGGNPPAPAAWSNRPPRS